MNRKSSHKVTKYATRINGQRSFESKQHSILQPSKAPVNCLNRHWRKKFRQGKTPTTERGAAVGHFKAASESIMAMDAEDNGSS